MKYPFCQNYANEAVTESIAAATFNCGFSGPRWDSTAEQHFRWCLDNVNQTIFREMQARGTQLVACQQGQ